MQNGVVSTDLPIFNQELLKGDIFVALGEKNGTKRRFKGKKSKNFFCSFCLVFG